MRAPVALRALPSVALRVWFTPPPRGRSAELDSADGLTEVTVPEAPGLSALTIGEGPLLLAFHGWGGRAAQMAPLARHLAARGWQVVAVDLPGRAGGESTNVKEVAATMRAAVEHFGPPVAVVAHSFASIAMRLAFPADPPAPAVVLLAPLIRVSDALEVFGRRAGLFWWTKRGLRRRLQKWDPVIWPLFDSAEASEYPGAALLVAHDPDDGDTPFPPAAELARQRPGAAMVVADGAGHAGILHDEAVLKEVASFLEPLVAGQRLAGQSPAAASLPAEPRSPG